MKRHIIVLLAFLLVSFFFDSQSLAAQVNDEIIVTIGVEGGCACLKTSKSQKKITSLSVMSLLFDKSEQKAEAMKKKKKPKKEKPPKDKKGCKKEMESVIKKYGLSKKKIKKYIKRLKDDERLAIGSTIVDKLIENKCLGPDEILKMK